jgi:hypothetical protein
VFVITEDTSQFSSGAPSPDDPLGCAGRRVPPEIEFRPGRSDQLFLIYVDAPGTPAFSPDGQFFPDGRFEVDFPDVGKNVEGRFETSDGTTKLVDGQLFSGDCTFFFTGEPK